MSKKKRINKNTREDNKTNGIGANKVLLDHDPLVKFSYKYLDLSHGKFSILEKQGEYFLKVFERLKFLSPYRVSELKTRVNDKSLRSHSIDWNDTTEDGFGIPSEEYVVEKPWQFEISANEHGRVHGFFIGNTFYIVWFDPEHKLYP